MNKIKRDELMLNSDSLANHLVIEALSAALSCDEMGQFVKDVGWNGKEEIECYLVVEGKHLPIMPVCANWGAQMDRRIAEKALALLGNKLSDLDQTISNISNEIQKVAANRLGLEFEEDY